MEKLQVGVVRLGLALEPGQLFQFQTYYEELAFWNRRMNLTAVVGYEEVQVRHFVDSLTVAWGLKERGWALTEAIRAVDVGTGPGLPGLALKIAFPQMRLLLLDSISKKAAFLRHLVSRLNLEEVEVVAGRAEEMAHREGYREGFDLALARGVAALPTLVELTLPFLKVGGCLVAQKGGQVGDEVSQASHALETLGGKLWGVIEVEMEGRTLVMVDKVTPTPPQYPRRPGVPGRRPL